MNIEEFLQELVAAISGVSLEEVQATAAGMDLGIWQGFYDFFFGLADLIGSLVSMIWQLVCDLPYISSVVFDFLGNVPAYFSWLPTEVVSLLCAIFGVVATYMIVGRG